MQYSRFANIYDALMRDVDYDKWTDYLLEIAKRFETPLSYAIDCACGTGAITTRMAKKGV